MYYISIDLAGNNSYVPSLIPVAPAEASRPPVLGVCEGSADSSFALRVCFLSAYFVAATILRNLHVLHCFNTYNE